MILLYQDLIIALITILSVMLGWLLTHLSNQKLEKYKLLLPYRLEKLKILSQYYYKFHNTLDEIREKNPSASDNLQKFQNECVKDIEYFLHKDEIDKWNMCMKALASLNDVLSKTGDSSEIEKIKDDFYKKLEDTCVCFTNNLRKELDLKQLPPDIWKKQEKAA